MAPLTHDVDLGALRLASGDGRRLDLEVPIEPLLLAGERYAVEPHLVPTRLDVSRASGNGYALRLRLRARLLGPCMRCLEPASPLVEVDDREFDQPGAVGELSSAYVTHEVLDVAGWARDAFALGAGLLVVCRPDCAGLCPVCACNLNRADPDHAHEPEPDPRWAKLRDLHLE